MDFRDKTNGENIQFRFILFYFWAWKIFNIKHKNYESDKGIFLQFFLFKKTVQFNLKIC